MKIDFHTHILPERLPNFQARYGNGFWPNLEHLGNGCARLHVTENYFHPVSENLWNPEKRIEELKKQGVTLQVLSTVPTLFSYWANPRHALDLCRLLNDHLAEVVRKYPEHFVALGTLPMQDPLLAIEELTRCISVLKFPGVEIGSHINGWNLDEEALFPFFKKAAELDAAIFVHPWDTMGPDRMERYFLPWLVGMPAETSLAICSIIFGGVLERLPKLRIAFAHGGGSFPMGIGRIEHAWLVRPDLCQTQTLNPPRTYLKQIYVDSLVHDPEVLSYLVSFLGKDNVMLGTDYPFLLREETPGKLIESLPHLDGPTKEKLLFRNALGFLGLIKEAKSITQPG